MKKSSLFSMLAAAYLGFALGVFTEISAWNWRLYAIAVPVIIFYSYSKEYYKDE